MQDLNQSASKQIRNLFIVIGSGVIGAALIAYFLVTFYSPNTEMNAENVILAPGVAHIDRVEWLNQDGVATSLDEDAYQKFYQKISGDKSIEPIPSKFERERPITLSIWVKRKSGQVYLFQDVQIEPNGDYYRVMLHQESKQPQWGYFYHPGLLEALR